MTFALSDTSSRDSLMATQKSVRRAGAKPIVYLLTTMIMLWFSVQLFSTGGPLSGMVTYSWHTCPDPTTDYILAHKPGTPFQKGRFPSKMGFLEALETCTTLDCLHDAHLQPKEGARFNFPHFMVIGWAKCATTSINKYLKDHTEVLDAPVKEPGFFSEDCTYDCGRLKCPADRTGKGQAAAYDATPQTVAMGERGLAKNLRQLMPWLKLVALLREPISRAMSARVMTTYKNSGSSGCLSEFDMAYCLLNDTSLKYGNPKDSYYSRQLRSWLDAYPKEQVMLIQFEELSGDNQREELRRLKRHLGIDVSQNDEDLRQANCLTCKKDVNKTWEISEAVYRQLIEEVKPDVLEVVKIIDEYKLGDGKRWLKNWQAVWTDNLATCKRGVCNIEQ